MTALEVKKSQLPATNGDVWEKFRREMGRLFDRFATGFELSPFHAASNIEYLWLATAPGMTAPAIDVLEDDKLPISNSTLQRKRRSGCLVEGNKRPFRFVPQRQANAAQTLAECHTRPTPRSSG